MKSHSVLLLFIDGLGIGVREDKNPFFVFNDLLPLAHFKDEFPEVIFGGILKPTDSRLGVEGRPQSASGQTTIFTGINAPQTLGFHKQGFPNQALRDILKEHSVFRQLKNLNIEPNIFANTYTPPFFAEQPRWKSATTVACEAAGIEFRQLSDLIDRKSLFHDFTNKLLIEKGYAVPLFSAADAARILAELAAAHRFSLYEYFLTDKVGHAQNFETAREILSLLSDFIREVLSNVDLKKTTVILTSDHGNVEDLSVRQHTLNDVPTIVWGRKNTETAGRINNLADITPAIIDLLTN